MPAVGFSEYRFSLLCRTGRIAARQHGGAAGVKVNPAAYAFLPLSHSFW